MTTKDEKEKAIHGIPACLKEGNGEDGIYGATCAAWVKTKKLEGKDQAEETAERTIHTVVSGPIMKMHKKVDFKE